MRKLIVLLVALATFMVVGALAAFAWPAPEVSGDCDGWYVTETAPDRDWKSAAYWTVDGVEGQHERGATVSVLDDSDATESEFAVRWFSAKGKQLDVRSTVGYRDLSGCEEPPVDVCPNIEGNQETVPDGLVVDENGDCVELPPPVEPTYEFSFSQTCDGFTVSWVGENLENLVFVAQENSGSGYISETAMDQATSSGPHPFGDYVFGVILDIGDIEVIDSFTDTLAAGEECEEEPPAPPTTEPPAPPTTEPPAPPTTQPAPDGDWAEPLPVESGGVPPALIFGGVAGGLVLLIGAKRWLESRS